MRICRYKLTGQESSIYLDLDKAIGFEPFVALDEGECTRIVFSISSEGWRTVPVSASIEKVLHQSGAKLSQPH